MKIFEPVAWIAWGFVPTLSLLEIYIRKVKRKKRVIPTPKLPVVRRE